MYNHPFKELHIQDLKTRLSKTIVIDIFGERKIIKNQ